MRHTSGIPRSSFAGCTKYGPSATTAPPIRSTEAIHFETAFHQEWFRSIHRSGRMEGLRRRTRRWRYRTEDRSTRHLRCSTRCRSPRSPVRSYHTPDPWLLEFRSQNEERRDCHPNAGVRGSQLRFRAFIVIVPGGRDCLGDYTTPTRECEWQMKRRTPVFHLAVAGIVLVVCGYSTSAVGLSKSRSTKCPGASVSPAGREQVELTIGATRRGRVQHALCL